MIIDCDRCAVRGDACRDCVISVLLGAPELRTPELRTPAELDEQSPTAEKPPGASVVQLDAPERLALDVLADQGLVPRLRLVSAPERKTSHEGVSEAPDRNVG